MTLRFSTSHAGKALIGIGMKSFTTWNTITTDFRQSTPLKIEDVGHGDGQAFMKEKTQNVSPEWRDLCQKKA